MKRVVTDVKFHPYPFFLKGIHISVLQFITKKVLINTTKNQNEKEKKTTRERSEPGEKTCEQNSLKLPEKCTQW